MASGHWDLVLRYRPSSSVTLFSFLPSTTKTPDSSSRLIRLSGSQVSAGYALGLTYWQMMRTVVLPQAFRNMTPILLTQTIILFQDTSLVYVLSLTDFLGAATKVAQRDGRLIEMYIFVAVVYFIMSDAASLSVRYLQRRTRIVR